MPYIPPLKELWKGRHDGANNERFHDVIKLVSDPYRFSSATSPAFAFIGFASDAGVRRNQGNQGANEGPRALRQALAILPVPRQGMSFYDCGDIMCEGDALEEAQKELAQLIEALLRKDIHPIVLGGGHEMAWGHYLGIYAANPEQEISIINFDAHFDLRPVLDGNKGSSGTSFLQIASHAEAHDLPFHYSCYGIQETGNTKGLFDQAHKLSVNYLLASEFHEGSSEVPLEHLDNALYTSENIYVSICLDVFASAFAPGVSARQPLGLHPWHVLPLLKALAASGKVVSLDIAELCPVRDHAGMTAQLAAALIFTFLQNVKTNA